MSRACLLLIMITCGVRTPLLAQDAGTASSTRACSLLTKDLIAKVSPYKSDPQMMSIMRPSEEALGANGSGARHRTAMTIVMTFDICRSALNTRAVTVS